MTKLTKYLRPYYLQMTFGLIIKFIGTVMDLFIPLILAHLIDDIVPLKSVPLILLWGGLMLLSAVLALVTNITANRKAARISADMTRTLRHDLFMKISYCSCHQIDGVSVPSLISRLTSDTYNVHQMVGMMQRLGVRAPILLIGGILMTISLDFSLSLILIAVLPFITVVVILISRKGIPLYNNLQTAVDKLVRTVRENITGVRVIKALSKSDYERERFSSVNDEVVKNEKKAGITMALTNPTMNLFLNIGLIVVILAGAYRVNDGLSEPGKIIAFLSYFTIILNALLSVTRVFVMLSKGSASFKRIGSVLDIPEDLALVPSEKTDSPYHITFENVSFSYNKTQNNIEHITFRLEKGETLGIIGATGSGKSTLIKLLMRFYDADSGMIRINGRDVKSIPPEELHTKFGVVFQNDVLFAESIRDNIDFGRRLSEAHVKRAASLAQAEEFISALDDGLEHELTLRGTNLSGGQKQRLLISRALAGSPKILILDDASSALDYQTDAALRVALGQNFKDTTTIIIAQRISSVLHADHIMVLDEGQIIGYGRHDDLLKTCESYSEIYRSQMG